MNPVEHVVYQLRNAQINTYPYPHFYCGGGVFPADFYQDLLLSVEDAEYKPLLKHRDASKDLGIEMAPFNSEYFAQSVVSIFEGWVYNQLGGNPKLSSEWRLIRDEEGYAIGPHTDAPWKVISLLFYLPRTCENFDCGTGVYVPDDHKKRCPGGPHHDFDGFTEVFRAPYVPNSCFGFWKTANSWHAVQKIERKIQRDVLLFNLYDESMRK